MQPLTKKYQNIGKLGVVTTPFGGATKNEPSHPAVDIANVKGTPISSPIEGVVTRADYGHVQGENNPGNSVTITDKSGNQHQFNHLNNGYVRLGQQVAKRQTLGQMGNTGATYSQSGKGDGTHLDYRIVSAYGKYKNPTGYIKNLAK